MFGGQAADLAGADDQHAAPLQAAEDFPRQRDRREADRHRAFAERGLRSHALADAERPVEYLVEQRTRALALRRDLEGVLHLPEDLRLADDQRVEPGRDP